MTFGPDHYVPVLKVKRGEKAALGAIAPRLRDRITPLLEIVEIGKKEVMEDGKKVGRKKTLSEHLDTSFQDLELNIKHYKRCLLDTLELAPYGPVAAEDVFHRAAAQNITFTPVTGISRIHDVQAALAHHTHGLAIRLTRQDLASGKLKSRLESFVNQHGLLPGDIDLIIDLGDLDAMVMEGVSALAQNFLGAVAAPTIWRTLTLSGCGYPKTTKEVKKYEYGHFARLEWVVWRDILYANRSSLDRLPSFSDCAIQHSSGVEGFDPTTMTASATVRYTLGDQWLLIKGESIKVKPSKKQYPELATHLVYGELKADYISESHCRGCADMKRAADGAAKLGSLEVWRRLGTIHHLTRAVEALTALPWP